MAVVLRLARAGAKKMPYYHVVATDSRNPRDGKFIEAIGAYDPNLNPPKVEFNQERLEHWLKVGAQPSETGAVPPARVSRPTSHPSRARPPSLKLEALLRPWFRDCFGNVGGGLCRARPRHHRRARDSHLRRWLGRVG